MSVCGLLCLFGAERRSSGRRAEWRDAKWHPRQSRGPRPTWRWSVQAGVTRTHVYSKRCRGSHSSWHVMLQPFTVTSQLQAIKRNAGEVTHPSWAAG